MADQAKQTRLCGAATKTRFRVNSALRSNEDAARAEPVASSAAIADSIKICQRKGEI